MTESSTRKLNVPLIIGDKNVDLDEIPDTIDMSIRLPVKNVPNETKGPKKQDSKTIPLF